MSEAMVYVFAPQLWRDGRKRVMGRGVKIELAQFHDDNSYTSGGVLVDGWVPCAKDADPGCYTMRARVTGQF